MQNFGMSMLWFWICYIAVTIAASSTTSAVKKHDISRSYSAWSASSSDSYFVRFNDTVRLTVRPYAVDSSTKLSNAKTYSPTVESGGQTYWTSPPPPPRVDVKANATEDNALCGLTGTWKF